jgi:restriction system protein
MTEIYVPAYTELMNPTIEALKRLGGSGSNQEIHDEVAEILGLSDEQLEALLNPEKGSQTVIWNRLAWARTYLKTYGVLENSQRGVWALTPSGQQLGSVDPEEVRRYVKTLKAERRHASTEDEGEPEDEAGVGSWEEELMATLLEMDPAAFERLVQRILRESGFTQVEVLGRSGDGGIDGSGIIRLGGLLSFHVIFQAKRWRNPVGPNVVRDFRGAMVGRADKALLITTSSFTNAARHEAIRDGAPPIDLIDGAALVEKIKELSLGLRIERREIEDVLVDREWFFNL